MYEMLVKVDIFLTYQSKFLTSQHRNKCIYKKSLSQKSSVININTYLCIKPVHSFCAKQLHMEAQTIPVIKLLRIFCRGAHVMART